GQVDSTAWPKLPASAGGFQSCGKLAACPTKEGCRLEGSHGGLSRMGREDIFRFRATASTGQRTCSNLLGTACPAEAVPDPGTTSNVGRACSGTSFEFIVLLRS